jgi:hypothetical protein
MFNLRKWLVRSFFVLLTFALGVGAAYANSVIGPSSSQSPYIVRSEPGVVTKSILTVGDSVYNEPDGSPYRMVGIPDGLGAFDNNDGTFTVVMNHELGDTLGVTRAHGAIGAFVSKWIINKEDLTVIHGEDLIQNIATWNPGGYWNPPAKGVALSRLCSADLPPVSAFYDSFSGLGTTERIFMNGEEKGAEGRAFAHLMDGTSYELPWLGKFSWENSVAHPNPGIKTVVAGLDDSGGGQVYVYVGEKTGAANLVEAAGLTNGVLYGIQVNGYLEEPPTTGIPSQTSFTAYHFGNVAGWTGAQLDLESKANYVTGFQRPEDGAWDPSNPRDFYFLTTASFTGNSRLWRLHFNDPANPAAGGTIDMLLDGSEDQKMMDNMTINRRGQIFIQEDPGNQAYVAKIWRYNISIDELTQIAQFDPDRFQPGAQNFLTQDEESSGIVDVSSILGEGWFLLDAQAHYSTDAELVEGGQLLAMHVPPGRK